MAQVVISDNMVTERVVPQWGLSFVAKVSGRNGLEIRVFVMHGQ
jgi:hypothetical protein